MEDYLNELKAEMEASVMKKVEKLIMDKTKCGVSDAVYWSKIARDIDLAENKLKEERKEKNKLKKKLDKLNQFALDVHNFTYGTEYNDADIVSAFEFTSILDKMKHDEKSWIDEVDDLRKEVDELKNERTKYKHMVENVWTDLYWADKNGENVAYDDIEVSVEYEKNKEYIKELVDDDE